MILWASNSVGGFLFFLWFSVFHFWHLHFRRLSNRKLYYYIICIIYNNKNNNSIITTSPSIHPPHHPDKSCFQFFITKNPNVKSEKVKNWKSSVQSNRILWEFSHKGSDLLCDLSIKNGAFFGHVVENTYLCLIFWWRIMKWWRKSSAGRWLCCWHPSCSSW